MLKNLTHKTMNYNIKITGSGTADEIINALKGVIESIEEAKPEGDAILDGAEWKDATLMTEISAE